MGYKMSVIYCYTIWICYLTSSVLTSLSHCPHSPPKSVYFAIEPQWVVKGDRWMVTCREIYKSARTTIVCQDDGTWSEPDPPCIMKVCPRPDLWEASYDGPIMKAAPGTTLTVCCKEQFVEAHPTIKCIDGQWTKPEPACRRVLCDFPDIPDNGRLRLQCRSLNCVISFTCAEGYWYTGTVTRTCQRNETWSGVAGKCAQKEL